jgi:predicted O-methyltransferase YrrM
VRIQTVAVLVAAWVAGALALGLATGAGAVPTVALMALGPLLGGLLLLIRHNLELASRIGNLADQSTRTFDTVQRVGARVEREIKKDLKQTFRQLEALQNLSAVLPASDVLPATRVWAASPDLLVVLVDLVISERPSLVVECGSGASTLWLALAMRRFGIDGRIIALDHDPVFGAKTRDLLARHDVRDLAEVRDAPLESFSLDGETYRWYARRAWEDLTGIDLLFVDGPPATTGHQARYPALPLLSGSLSPVATAVLDDLVVPDMQKVLQLWLDAYPDFSSEILPLEKQAAVLRRTCAGRLSLEASPLLPDLQHDLAAGVLVGDPAQRLARLLQRQHRRDLGAQRAGLDQAAQCLQPLAVDVGGERFARDAALELCGGTLKDHEDRPAAIADRADGLVAGLAAGAVQQQVDAAVNRGTHLLDPVRGVVVEHLAGAQAPQVVVVGWAGHAQRAGAQGHRDLHGGAPHSARGGGDEHGFAGAQPPSVD